MDTILYSVINVQIMVKTNVSIELDYQIVSKLVEHIAAVRSIQWMRVIDDSSQFYTVCWNFCSASLTIFNECAFWILSQSFINALNLL